MRRREFSFPTIIGLLITLVGLGVGLVLLRNPLLALVGASPEETPSQVKITNVTDTEFVVSWLTDKATTGYLKYGESSPELVVSDDRDQESGTVGNYLTHLVTIKNLTPETTYVFTIGSGRTTYDDGGKAYQVITGPVLRNPPPADVAYGRVVTAAGEPAVGAIVYLNLPGIMTQAALVKSSGSWVVPLSTSRTTDLTSYAPYDLAADKLEIFVQAGSLGTAQQVVTTAEDSPVADIILGTVQDLATTTPTLTQTLVETTPDPAITPLPTLASKFTTDALEIGSTPSSTLSILTPQITEEVNTSKPEIIGRGPAGTQISIEIHSNHAITATVVVAEDGTWSYSVPTDLEPGNHTITITALVDGVVKTITRSFTVQAAESSNNPAQSASPSATLAPSPSPTTATTSPSPSPTRTPTPTLVPRVALPSTESGVPQSGSLTPTVILAILGIGLVLSGLFVNYSSKRS